MRQVHPPVSVTVTTTAPWPAGDWSGLLSYWRRDADGWRGFVAFNTGVGQQRLGWFPADQLRPGEPLGRDEPREIDVPLKFSDRPAVVDRTRPAPADRRRASASRVGHLEWVRDRRRVRQRVARKDIISFPKPPSQLTPRPVK